MCYLGMKVGVSIAALRGVSLFGLTASHDRLINNYTASERQPLTWVFYRRGIRRICQ